MRSKICLPHYDVIIPAFNAEPFLLQTLQSVEAQTVPPRIVAVVDDCSTDGTAEVFREWQKTTLLECMLISNDSRRGPSEARNAALPHLRSEWVAFLDSDDLWLPSKMQKQLRVIADGGPGLGLVYSGYTLIDDAGKTSVEGEVVLPRFRGSIERRLLTGNVITGSASSAVVRVDSLLRCGGFSSDLSSAEDWDLWLRLSREVSFDFVQESLVRIRRHSQNLQNGRKEMALGQLRFMAKRYENFKFAARPLLILMRDVWKEVKDYRGDEVAQAPLVFKLLFNAHTLKLLGPVLYFLFRAEGAVRNLRHESRKKKDEQRRP